MSGYLILNSIYFATLGTHGLIYMGWSGGGVKSQRTYVLLFWLSFFQATEGFVRFT